ncbi:hypothetical protein RhiTH_009123 [Rhizoctonia solani]
MLPSVPPPTKAAHTPMRWQPIPGAPLVPPSPLNKGELGPSLLATADEHGSLKPKLEQELNKTKEATKETQDWMGAVNQALACIEGRGGAQPHTPKDQKPLVIEATPRPIPEANPLPAPSAPFIAWANTSGAPPAFAQPTPVQAPPRVPSPTPSAPVCLCPPQIPQPQAPVATY